MLKALELVGFKSFADKTRLDFPDGISVVVGPNGSGKSNIVDAIKWVLGEQSAKSLRGKEMTDVIFKGSGAGASARKPSNTAEATIIFDNSDGRLSLDAPEIHVTRRVYRSGEGEYLINRQACRLRDIKDLFRGTGVGTDAYSLIEQGKVDTLLQASVRDRRAIFEEAAGISRFKAKKVEAQRRLERVEQNLLRLSDIVEEVESRLRTLRAQASKARRYREYTDRLQQLRTQVAQVDWRRLSERLAACQEELAELQQQTQGLSSRQQSVEARILESETEIALVDEELRSGDARIAQTGERIRSQESTAQRERERLAEAQSQEARFRRQLVAMNTRAGDAVSQLRNVADELHNAQNVFREATKQRDDKSSRVEEQTSRVEQLRVETRDLRDRHMQRLRHHSELESQIVADQERLKTSEQAETRATESLEALQSKRNQCTSKLHSQQEIGQRLSSTVTAQKAELTVLRNELAKAKSGLTSIQNQLSEKRGQCAGNRERAKVLEELESRLEGVGSGVKTVLKLGREQPQGVFGGVRGLIADLISAGVDAAPMVDIALGPQSQCVVFAGTRLVEHLKSGEYELPGRVGFLSLESALPLDHTYHIDLSGQPGVIGRADHFVEVPREYRLLIRRLVGTTWFVESLDHAISLSQTLGRGLRYVTRTGELLDVDGRLLVGPMQSHAGLVSRRSELRALRDQLVALEGNLRELSDEERRLHAATAKLDEQLETLVATHQQSIAELAEHKLLINSENQRLAEVDRQISSLQSELRTVAVQRQSTAERLESARHQCKSVNVELGEIQAEMQARETELAELDAKRRADLEELTALRVEVGKKEQRVESLHTHLAQLQRDQQDRGRALTETRRHIDHWASQRRRTELDILAATSKASEMHLQLENDSQFRAARQHHRDALITTRAELVDQVSHLRHEMRESEQRQHRAQLAASQASQERDSLAERLRDDYDIELAQLDDVSDDRDVKQREAVEQEITDLRRKISNIGPVNLDALNELESIEDRHGSLADQYRDLVDAKESLQRIIQKINKDSRRLFKETLEAIRVNFQGMFRKVFGGGRADILLEDGVDILESGIDLVATPPGKQTLGLSLLSGGERALTAVTLLLAIFKYRPSPFCVLDEVDGPLDEANIDRFIDVLHGFLDSTKFVVVTHSKKTMTAANTLYGITMQESGISKRVAVQFEDVSDDGHISREAVERDTTGETIADSDERGAA